MKLSARFRKALSPQFSIDLAFDIEPGVTIVFGESGSGKTTLLRVVAGLIRPDVGRVAIGDRVLLDTDAGIDVEPSQRRVGFVFQHLALFPHLTASDNIAYGLSKLPPSARRQLIEAVAESFRIRHVLSRRPAEISGGERQRVGLARSLVTSPDVLLLDEPLSALDAATQARIIADLRRWNDSRHIPVLYVTHSQREVFALGERVLVLQNGAILADGPPQQVMNTPAYVGLAHLAGFENLLEATVVDRRPDAGVMATRLTGTSIDLETPLADVEIGRPVRVAIRAGDILVASERPHGLSARNLMAGTVAGLERQGTIVRATVSVGVPLEVHLTPLSSAELGLQAGRDVWLVIKTHSCHPITAV
jgi:molybdate transport system ATP-binding protein